MPFHEDLAVPTQAEKDTLLAQIKLLDPPQEGIKVHQLRSFYPKLGWHVINQRLYALVEDGKLTRAKAGRPVPVEIYTWT